MKTNIKSFTKFILTSFFSIIYFSVFSQNAKVQVIHNSPGAPAVDVWVNGSTVLSGVIFRQASGFLDVPVTTPTTVQIAVTGSNPYTIVSTDVLTLTSDMSYRAIATGVVGTTVSGQEFDVTYFGATTTTMAGFTGLDIYHSSPDAPAVGVVARGVATLVSSFSFKESADNVSVPSDSYTLDINAGNGSGATVASFTAPLSGFAGKNIAVLSSGLLSGTPSFGLIAVASDGTVIELPSSPTSTKGASKLETIIYPNPVSDILNVNVLKPGNYTYNLVNALGVSSSFSSSIISVSGLSSGIYILQVIENGEVKTSQKVLVK